MYLKNFNISDKKTTHIQIKQNIKSILYRKPVMINGFQILDHKTIQMLPRYISVKLFLKWSQHKNYGRYYL